LVTFPPENDVNAELWGHVVGVKFLVDIQAVCVIFSHGDVVLFHNEATETGDTLEIVGSVDSGISCMAWSPDEELVVMVTGEGSILEMTKDFDVIAENPIDVEESGEDVSVNVGWGKKETQFHGTEGKHAAQRKVDTSTFTLSPDDDDKHRLSWRGDGTYFCCSSKDKRLGRRVIRVYNREAILQTTSESVDMLEHGLSWRPSGNLIASSQRLPHRHDIVFFERNGLRHGEFTLKEANDAIVKELAWNCDSTVLAVWLERPNSGSCIQLWTMNNYKWYMKQELMFNGDGSAVAGLQWDVESALVLHVVTESGSYQRNQYCWDTYVNEDLRPENLGTVAVVDGANLMVTPFRVMNVPPPMSAFTLALPYAIQHVSFSTTHHGDDMAVLLADQRVAFLEMADKTTRPLPEPKLLGLIELAEVPSVLVRQIAWARPDTLIGLQYDSDISADSIVVVKLAFDEATKEPKVVSRTDVPLEGLYQRLYFNATFGDILLQQADGNVMTVELKDDEEPKIGKWMELHRLPEGCLWMGTTRIGTGNMEYREKAVVGLARNNRLYVNDRLISSETTSFCLHNHFLVFTTATHSARFLPLETSMSDFKIVDNSMLPYDESIRRVERGSKIVLALPYSVNLVLQMPRGNLETVAPRAMVLSVTRDALDRCDFRTAFVTCRKHRIDLNILYDHNPKVFMDNVGEFVKQVKEVDYLNLFLSFLRNEDVTQTLYPLSGSGSGSSLKQLQQPSQTYGRRAYGAPISPELAEKVNKICDAVRKELHNLDRNTYINSVLTTYVRKSPPDLESALLLLAQLKDQDQALAEDALKFTIFLADVDRLFDVALGMYDFALVLMVAQWSQKDPREYLPFLNELRTLEKYYQRFRIDDHLKKYQSALQNLSQAGERYFEDCVNYIKQHNLYKFALKVFGSNPVKHKAILQIYGDSLSVNGDHEQAGVAYSMAGDKEKALESFREAGQWKEAVVLAQQLKYDPSAMAYLARGMSESLKIDKRYNEAGLILAEYAKDAEEAVAALLEGRLWSEATRTAYVHNRVDLITTHVTPGIADGHHDLVESIRDMQEQFDKQTQRLKEVRDLMVEKALAEAAEEMGAPDDALDNVDMMSDTTSMASGFSRYTAVNSMMSKSSHSSRSSSQYTARLKKRNEKKRARGKKGSAFEEEYLINSLRKLIVRVDTTKSDVHALLKVLASTMSLERAKVLQQEFGKLLTDIDEQMHIIFIPPTEEYLAKKKAAEDAKTERKKLIRQNQANAHLMSRHEEAVAQAQISQLEEIAEQEIADIYGEPPVMSKENWDVDLV
ncbi:hypothetical protein BGX28_009840, partial [Mortierella sp. GBA30]